MDSSEPNTGPQTVRFLPPPSSTDPGQTEPSLQASSPGICSSCHLVHQTSATLQISLFKCHVNANFPQHWQSFPAVPCVWSHSQLTCYLHS